MGPVRTGDWWLGLDKRNGRKMAREMEPFLLGGTFIWLWGLLGQGLDFEQDQDLARIGNRIERVRMYKWHFKLHEDNLDMYKDHDIRDALEAMEAALGHIMKTNPLYSSKKFIFWFPWNCHFWRYIASFDLGSRFAGQLVARELGHVPRCRGWSPAHQPTR